MSTLTSSHLHIKRSSTRLHAPPGGSSSLSFGPGGFGSSQQSQEREDEPPQTSSGYSPETESYKHFDHAFPATPHQPQQHTVYRNPMEESHNQYHNNPSIPLKRPQNFPRAMTSASSANTVASSQPPLTSSKRDQNWAKKRRLYMEKSRHQIVDAIPQSNTCMGMSNLSNNFRENCQLNEQNMQALDSRCQGPPSPLSQLVSNVQESVRGCSRDGYSRGGMNNHDYINNDISIQRNEISANNAHCIPQQYNVHNNMNSPLTARSNQLQNNSSYQNNQHHSNRYNEGHQFDQKSFNSNGSYASQRRANNQSSYGTHSKNVFSSSGSSQCNNEWGQQRIPTSNSVSSQYSSKQPPGGKSNWSPFSGY